jgi:hypothetical protein
LRLAYGQIGSARSAVDGATAGGEHDLAGTGPPGPFHHVEAANHVDHGVEHWIGHRDADIDLGCQVEDDVGLTSFDQVGDGRIPNVEPVELKDVIRVGSGVSQVGQ